MIDTEHVVYRVETPSLTVVSEEELSPITGMLKSALLHFPARCNILVEVEIWHKNKKILPSTRDGISLDDATVRFTINEPVDIGDSIEVISKNHDNTYSHTIIAILEIEGEVKKKVAR